MQMKDMISTCVCLPLCQNRLKWSKSNLFEGKLTNLIRFVAIYDFYALVVVLARGLIEKDGGYASDNIMVTIRPTPDSSCK
jgi:hypothetical protein